MKKYRAVIGVMTIIAIILSMGILKSIRSENKDNSFAQDDLCGVWIASVYHIDFPSKAGICEEQAKKELETIVENVASIGGNAIFFQVRPSADALYLSEYFPISRWLSGKEGENIAQGFDPLAYLIKISKEKKIAVHAWLNPYNVTRAAADRPSYDLSYMSPHNPLRKYEDCLVYHTDGQVYMDPGKAESRALILLAVEELLRNYDIAGIHYDDYFYPEGDFPDQETFLEYGAGFASIEDWRRDNINRLIQQTGELVHKIKPAAVFGVSPAGVWANKSAEHPDGSDTYGGSETYHAHYADTKKWVQEGWVDYIAPQIYWNIGYKPADYMVLSQWWSNVVKDTGVKLYIGHALYKLGDDTQSKAWMDADEIIRQLERNRQLGIDGSIFYGYSKIKENKGNIQTILREYKSQISHFADQSRE